MQYKQVSAAAAPFAQPAQVTRFPSDELLLMDLLARFVTPKSRLAMRWHKLQ